MFSLHVPHTFFFYRLVIHAKKDRWPFHFVRQPTILRFFHFSLPCSLLCLPLTPYLREVWLTRFEHDFKFEYRSTYELSGVFPPLSVSLLRARPKCLPCVRDDQLLIVFSSLTFQGVYHIGCGWAFLLFTQICGLAVVRIPCRRWRPPPLPHEESGSTWSLSLLRVLLVNAPLWPV